MSCLGEKGKIWNSSKISCVSEWPDLKQSVILLNKNQFWEMQQIIEQLIITRPYSSKNEYFKNTQQHVQSSAENWLFTGGLPTLQSPGIADFIAQLPHITSGKLCSPK